MSLVMENTHCVICIKKVLNSEKGLQREDICGRCFQPVCVNISDCEYCKCSTDVKNEWILCRAHCVQLNQHPLNNIITKSNTLHCRRNFSFPNIMSYLPFPIILPLSWMIWSRRITNCLILT